MLDLDAIGAVTFDCYGTLIDWESGILGALRRLSPLRQQSAPGDEDLLELYARVESELTAGPYRPYREVLREATRRICAELGDAAEGGDLLLLERSLAGWRPFPDTVAALRAIAARRRIAILSNIDRDLFAQTQERLGVRFDAVVTAEDVGSYKPAAANFERLVERVGLPPGGILHAAQSLYHDIGPARAAGLATVWVDRRRGRKGGTGATPPADARADTELPDLASLARLLAGDGGR